MEATQSTTARTEITGTIGDFIRQRRIALGMTQSELCRKLGKYQVWVSQRECGHVSVGSEDLPALAEALQVDAGELQSLTGVQDRPDEPKVTVGSATAGVITKEVITTEVISWQVGDRSMSIEELSREDLLGAVRTLFEANGRLRAEFEKEMGEMAEAYEQKIHSLHHILAAHVELAIRDAVHNKMEAILEVVVGEVKTQTSK